MKEPVLVIGHKNPDTDSVCSAIAYAYLKSKVTKEAHSPKRAGHLNEETQYVLKTFDVPVPEYIKDVSTQVKDIDFNETSGVCGDISLRAAWTYMKEHNMVTLPVVDGGRLCGLITISDIAKSLMDNYGSDILSKAGTTYKNITETLEGVIEVGSEDSVFDNGKVLIATANLHMMESLVEPGDMVIVGNRYEAQLCAIEMNASCLIICDGAKPTITIKKLAGKKECTIISTPYDTYTVARFVNQSMPINYFMKSKDLITFHLEDYIDNIQDIMAKKRFRDFPILDKDDNFVGMLSRRNLLGANRKQVILVDHNEKNQAVHGIEEANILEIIDHHRLGPIETMTPVYFRNQPLGCTATIVYQMFIENDIEIPKEIASILCAAILSDTLIYRSPTCTPVDKLAAKSLAKIAGIKDEEFGASMFNAGSNLGVKSVKEIFNQDFKRFTINDTTFGIGQINSMNSEELNELKPRLNEYIRDIRKSSDYGMIFFMLTNIMAESSELLYSDDVSRELIEMAFNVKARKEGILLKGVVSRKKQLLPAIMESLQQ